MRRAVTVAMLFVLTTSFLQVTPAEARRSCRHYRRQCYQIRPQCYQIRPRAACAGNIEVKCLPGTEGHAEVTGIVTVDTGSTLDQCYYRVRKESDPVGSHSGATPFMPNADCSFKFVTSTPTPDENFVVDIWVQWHNGLMGPPFYYCQSSSAPYPTCISPP